MSKLLRMQILGIRSFGPDEDDVQQIRFQAPLTLIQGQNGCGKTTIIESIKFAITGELPGGSNKGQGFVYDPKLAKAYETRGQVKLRVSDMKGEWVTVTKSVSVQRKQSNELKFNRLDSTITRGKNNDTSGRCIDIDTEMCSSLGVSKSVLNNVIFCHQEDSSWPLDEGKKLKERFDDIFDATKYNKCLDTIAKHIKTRAVTQKLLQVELVNCLDKKNYVEEKRLLCMEKEHKLEDLNVKITEIQTKFEPIVKRLEEIDNIELNFNKLYTDAAFKKKELTLLNQQQQEISKNIKEFVGTDAELHDKLKSFENDFKNIQNDIQALEAKKLNIEKAENNLRKSINDYKMKLGELQSEEKQNLLKITSRNNLLASTVDEFEIKTIELITDDTSDDEIRLKFKELNNVLSSHKRELNNLEIDLENEEKALQIEIDKVREEYAHLNQNITSKTKQFADFNSELKQLKNKLSELDSADKQLELVDSKLNRLNREHDTLEASVNIKDLKSNIESERKKLNNLEDRLTEVDSEIQNLQHYNSLQTELDLKKEARITKENELYKLKNKHENSLKIIFPDGLPKSNLKYTAENFQKTQSKLVKELNKQISDKQREVMKLEASLNSQREKLNEKQNDLESNRKEISKYCDEKPLEDIVNTTQEKIEKLQNDKGIYFSSQYIYKKFIKNFENEDPCPICKRKVDEKKYVKEIISDLNKKIETFPNELKKVEKTITDEQTKYEKLLALKPVSEKMQKLENDVTVLKNEVENLEMNLVASTEELSELKEQISGPQKNEEIANSIMGDVSLIDQYNKELVQIKEDIAVLAARLPSTDESRGTQEAINEQETLKTDIRSIRQKIDNLQNKLVQHTERLQKIKEQRNTLIAQQLDIKKNLQDKNHLLSKSQELKSKIETIEIELQDLKTQLGPLKTKLRTAEKKKEDQKEINKNKYHKSRAKYNNLQKKINDIDNLQTSIDECIKKNIPKTIADINESISKVHSELVQHSDKKTAIDQNVDELKTQITNGKMYLRELQDNVQLREKRKKADKLKNEIAELDAKLGNNDINKIRQEKSQLLDEEQNLREQKHKTQGQKQELQTSIKEIRKELQRPENEKAAINYKRKFLELKLLVRSTFDLKDFFKSMDWALLQFHSQKMIQVNNTVKTLWRQIYRGNDIDYIEIKTSDENKVGTDKRKVYQYRVVQVKNQIELDMRGRCSAGQRVLASLIIRIALAETFSTNCGILALDEPTTNLDRENINSLSEALIDLINQKKQQKNFQLLIITHDQEFVDRLTKVDSIEKYLVVKRNEAGKSIITEQIR